MAVPVTESQVIDALRPVQDPEIGTSIVELEMVRAVIVDGGLVTVLIALTVAGCPMKAEIESRVTEAVAPCPASSRSRSSSRSCRPRSWTR